MRSRLAARAAAAALLGLTLAATPASAQEAAPSPEARVHFDRAVALFESGDASGALAEFQRAYELSGRASVLYNIGASHQALHDYPRAIEALRRFLAAGDARPGPQRELAARALRQMEPLVARLRLVREPAGVAVTVDGRAAPSDEVTVGPGTHAVAATAPGHQPALVEVTVVSGDDREVRLALTPVPPLAPLPVVAPPAPPPRQGRAPFWSMVITGGALGLGASITGVLAVAAQRDYASRRVDDPTAPALASRGRALAVTADVLALGALGAGATALVLGLVAGARRVPAVQVTLAPGGGSLAACGTF